MTTSSKRTRAKYLNLGLPNAAPAKLRPAEGAQATFWGEDSADEAPPVDHAKLTHGCGYRLEVAIAHPTVPGFAQVTDEVRRWVPKTHHLPLTHTMKRLVRWLAVRP